ncbi:MAG: pyridoxal phosphate-dependent aminotransferase [Eubacteriales bacterium]|nr:pyridoxal phosphate-dependent aminotransferase [Eubacteriales bacterium]
MELVSGKGRSVPKSAIREMFALQAQYDRVVSFALGEPHFPLPEHIRQAIEDSLRRGETHYTPNSGIMPLRQAISEAYERERGLSYLPEETLVAPGAIAALHLTVSAITDFGDEVILPDPGWANYRGLMIQEGLIPVPVRLREENRFMFDPAELEAAITKKTRAILINSPSNPTGGVADRKNLEQIAALAIRHDLIVITDEIYRELIWTDEPYASIAEFPGMRERTVIIDGFSKTYAMTGLRLGYAVAPLELIRTMNTMLENVYSCVGESVQWGGVAALTGTREPVEAMKAEYRKKRKLVAEGLNGLPGISCLPPAGAFYVFANITGTGMSCRDFAMDLLREQQVVVVPGTGFGAGGEGFVRLSYATGEDTIREGVDKIGAFVRSRNG